VESFARTIFSHSMCFRFWHVQAKLANQARQDCCCYYIGMTQVGYNLQASSEHIVYSVYFIIIIFLSFFQELLLVCPLSDHSQIWQ